MMREILFRGKRMDNGGWVEGYLCKTVMHIETFHQNVVVDCIEVYDGESYLNIVFRNVSANSIGQYTGLKDKNGKRIFEGDIVEHHVQGNILVNRGVVNWDKENARWAYRLNTMNPCFALYNPKAFEVIGNIHDNPELLGGAEDGK